MKKIYFFILLFTLLINYTVAQNNKIKWGKIKAEDFSTSDYFEEQNAPAIILFNKTEIEFDVWEDRLRLFYSEYKRIKIQKTTDLKSYLPDIEINEKDRFEILNYLDAVLYELSEKSKIKKTKLDKKNFKAEKTANGKTKIYIEFENLKPGMIVEYKYRILTFDFVNPRPYYIQSKLPVKETEFHVNTPDFITYRFSINKNADIKEKKQSQSFIHYEWKFNPQKIYTQALMYNMYANGLRIRLSFHGNYLLFLSENIPAFEEVPFTPSIHRNYSNISLALVETKFPQPSNAFTYSRTVEGAIQELTKPLFLTSLYNYKALSEFTADFQMYPGGYFVYKTDNWLNLNKKLMQHEEFGMRLIKFIPVKQFIDSIDNLQNNNVINKMNHIYLYVVKNYKWNGVYTIFADKDWPELAKTKYGSSGDINLFMINLLKKAGFDANPVILCTKEHGIVDTTFASIQQFNHVIASVKIEDKHFFLDAIHPYKPTYFVGEEYLGTFGMLVDKKNPEWLWIDNTNTSIMTKNIHIDLFNNKMDSIHTNIGLTGYFAFEIRKKNQLNEFVNQHLIGEKVYFRIDSLNQINSPISLTIKSCKKITNTIGDSILLYPFDFIDKFSNPFIYPDREIPVEFSFPSKKAYRLFINIPDGFIVKKIPAPVKLQMPDQSIDFYYSYVVESNKIIIDVYFNTLKKTIHHANYSHLRKIFELITNKAQEVLILHKK